MSAALTEGQKAFMRDFLTRAVAGIGQLPPSEQRDRALTVLRGSLAEYEPPRERPQLRLIAGGRS